MRCASSSTDISTAKISVLGLVAGERSGLANGVGIQDVHDGYVVNEYIAGSGIERGMGCAATDHYGRLIGYLDGGDMSSGLCRLLI